MKSPPISGIREAPGKPSGERRQTLLASLAAGSLSTAMVARFLTPTDGAVSGETLWIAQITFVALILWSLAVLQGGRLRLHFDAIDAAGASLCLGHIIGSLVVIATGGDRRAAMTMLWEWIGLAVTFFLMRQFLTSTAIRRSLLLTVAAVAVAVSGLGLWQHHVGYSETRQTYQRMKSELEALEKANRPATAQEAVDRDRRRRELQSEFAQTGIPTSESARMLWEQRLLSSEPIGLFALANTLAGFIAPALVLWLGTIVSADRGRSRWATIAGLASIALIADCLVLTKSRTAFVGLLAGLVTWRARAVRTGSAMSAAVRWGMAAGAVALIALLIGTAVSGGLDRHVVTESGKSLRYRIEYWTATWQMLFDSPRNWLLGIGPGNFRQNYLPFKLPQSSEEIADPHNLVLDVWSNGGLIGLAGLAGICFAVLRPLWCRRKESTSRNPETVVWNRWVFLGGGLAHLCVMGPDFGNDELLALLSLLLVGWLLVVLLCQPLFGPEPDSIVLASAGVVLIVHLLGAGGVGMPAIAQTLLFMAALGSVRKDHRDQSFANQSDPRLPVDSARSAVAGSAAPINAPERTGGWTFASDAFWPATVISLIAVALFTGCWYSGLGPVLNTRAWIASGQHELFDSGRPANAERDFLRAAAADRWSVEPAELLSQLFYQRAFAPQANRDDEFGRSIEWQQQAIARNPRLAGEHRLLGELYLSIFARSEKTADALRAADAFQAAISLYPNHALTQSELAEALWKGGRPEAARLPAQKARDLDLVNKQAGHVDKQLPPDRFELMSRILEARDPDPN